MRNPAFKAIVVKFIGPSNVKGSRWIVTTEAKRMIFSKGHFCDHDDNLDARMAAETYRDAMGWQGDLIEAGLPDGSRVFVFAPVVFRDTILALRRAIPWLGKMIADGGHMNSVAPNDAIGALAQAQAALDETTEGTGHFVGLDDRDTKRKATGLELAMLGALRAIVFQVCQGKVLERDACITQAREAMAQAKDDGITL